SPPPGAIVVGPGGKYANLTAALADTSSSVYFINSGTYDEQVLISRSNIKIFGQTTVPLSYSGNTVTITNSLLASTAGSNDLSGTVRVHATNVSLYNLNIANTFGHGPEQSQAIALSVQDGQFGAYGLKLTGYQDTLLANVGVEFYGNCWIEGAVDFIFGMSSSIWITNSIINVSPPPSSFVPHRRSTDDANCAPQTDNVTFAEYNNTGDGSTGVRASFATKLTAPVSISTVIGSTSWIDSQFL
ncbi:hypothetical protein EW026_g8297, partial [Hermanssonia centrifuga]